MRRQGHSHQIQHAVRYTVAATVISFGLLLSGCGGSGGGGSAAPSAGNAQNSTLPMGTVSHSFAFTADDYGMENPTYLSATTSQLGLVLRAAVASSMTDPDFKTVSRIDIADPGALAPGTAYSLGGGASPAFPGNIDFFNGHQSTLLRTVAGSITFDAIGTNAGDPISGSFSAMVEDGGDTATPKAVYTISARFNFTAGDSGAKLPASAPVPALASSAYAAKCASCHALGSVDPSVGSGPDLALKGGKLGAIFTAGVAGHGGVTLAGAEISALKVLLNIN